MAEELGLTVIEAAGAMEAVDIFRLRHGDLSLVLLDLTLPSMDGRETLKEIHRIDSSIPVVLGSPHGAKDDEVPMEVQAGVLGKPYRLAEFRGLVQRALA